MKEEVVAKIQEMDALGIHKSVIVYNDEHRTVTMSFSTLESLIAKAQQAEVCVPMCVGCGFSLCAKFYKDTVGRPISYCYECKPEWITEEWEGK